MNSNWTFFRRWVRCYQFLVLQTLCSKLWFLTLRCLSYSYSERFLSIHLLCINSLSYFFPFILTALVRSCRFHPSFAANRRPKIWLYWLIIALLSSPRQVHFSLCYCQLLIMCKHLLVV